MNNARFLEREKTQSEILNDVNTLLGQLRFLDERGIPTVLRREHLKELMGPYPIFVSREARLGELEELCMDVGTYTETLGYRRSIELC